MNNPIDKNKKLFFEINLKTEGTKFYEIKPKSPFK